MARGSGCGFPECDHLRRTETSSYIRGFSKGEQLGEIRGRRSGFFWGFLAGLFVSLVACSALGGC